MSAGLTITAACSTTLRTPGKPATAKLTMPVLAVGGERSFGPAVAASFAHVAQNTSGVVIPGAGHWIPEEYPAQLSATLLDFLA